MNATRTPNPAEWVDQYGDYLFNFAVGQIHNTAEGEDLVQETFLAALKSRERFGHQCSERTWLVSILRHKICDHLRSKCRQRRIRWFGDSPDDSHQDWDAAVLWVHDAAAQCVMPDRWLELDEFRSALESALGGLPARLAQVFDLYEIKELSGSEVCRTMDISEDNLWVMLHRARAQLRKTLAPVWQESRN